MSFPGGVNWTALSHQNEHLSHQKTWCVLVMTALGHGGFSSQSPCLTILPSLWPPALPQRPLGQPSLCRQQNSAQWGWPHNDAWNLECSNGKKVQVTNKPRGDTDSMDQSELPCRRHEIGWSLEVNSFSLYSFQGLAASLRGLWSSAELGNLPHCTCSLSFPLPLRSLLGDRAFH